MPSTKEKLAETQMLLEKSLARQASLERLTAQVAHEFNNVLMGMQPAVDLVRLQQGRNPQQVLRFADRIASSIHRGKRITTDILRFARPAEPILQELGAENLLREIADEIGPTLPDRIALRIDAAEGAYVLADREQLTQVLINLAFNARDAMHHHGGTLTLSVRRAERRDGFVQFTVTDTGSGIAAEDLPRIFEPLFSTKRCGTGLGLAIVSQIVTAHGGQIRVDSERGKGSAFHVFLPAAAEQAKTALA